MITVSDYCKNKYGEKLYKLALSGNFTCPNRDGKLGSKGCIFCSNGGSGDFAADKNLNIDEQIEFAKLKIKNKFKGDKYIAYFQSFSNTYASIEYLKSLYDPLILRDDIKVISIATRPDCLDDEIIEYLSELNTKKDLWVELGLQSTKEESIRYIRRGYETKVYDEAIKKLNDANIHTISHVILGLPKESIEDMLNTVDHVVMKGSKGIKLQLLHVLKNTDLEQEYNKGAFETLTFDEYIKILKLCLEHLPDDMVVHRLTGDGPKKDLIAPLWSANKREVINRINKEVLLCTFPHSRLRKNGTSQFMAGEVSTTSSASCTKAECPSRKSPDSLVLYER